MLFNSVTQIIGDTPLLKLNNFGEGLGANIYAKLEYLNPAGSIKDRTALSMLEDAEKRGILKRGATIIEPTSGNTGIGLAAIAAQRGYRCILTMPEGMSEERRKLLSVYGAEVVLTDKDRAMTGAIERAYELNDSIDGSIVMGQFENQANPEIHYRTTAPEIYNDLNGKVDIFVACVGTGGTLSGVGRFLKEKNEKAEVYAVEPVTSPLLSKGYSGEHAIQGIGPSFVPKTLDSVYDGVICVSDAQAFATLRQLAKSEGVFCGISSGAALCAARLLAKENKNAGKNIAVILPDSGDRYLSVL